MSHKIAIEGGTPVRLPTAGKYCNRDIDIFPENLDDALTDQDGLIAQIQTALRGKASGGSNTPTQEKTVEITENGTIEIVPDDGYALSKVTANVKVASSGVDNRHLYQRIEYIESTTGCKVVTDIFANNETGMELLAKYPVLADRVPMGSRLDGNATRFYIPYPLSANSFYYGFNAGSTRSTGAKANTLYRAAVNFLNHRCVLVMEDATNASEFAYNLTETLSTQTAPVGIFCYLRNVDGEYTVQSSRDMIFYMARISQGKDIVREYIPCYRKSDGEIGLYETFTGTFLVNEGTGTFTKGADVEW